MNMEEIEEIGIDVEERLYVKPSSSTFPLIYREAMEVNWNEKRQYLYGSKPKKWGYVEWYLQILKAASEQGCTLVLTSNTNWTNISDEITNKIKNA